MALFAHLEIEDKLQVKDKTRMKADKSYITKGATAISTATIKPGADAIAIDIFDTTLLDRFLEFQFANFNGDIGATNNKLDFDEGASELTATISTST